MTKNLLSLFSVAVLLSLAFSAPSEAKGPDARKRAGVDKHTSNITEFSVPRHELRRIQKFTAEDAAQASQSASGRRYSVGSAATAAASPGLVIRETWDDWQDNWNFSRRVEVRGSPDVHFSYSDHTSNTPNTQGFGYNVYDPATGTWPNGFQTGCRIQQDDGTELGAWPSMDVSPEGLVIIAGRDNVGQPRDNHLYFQSSAQNCFFGGGARIPPSQYRTGMGSTTATYAEPLVEISINGTDTTLHVVGTRNTFAAFVSPDYTETVINYFRRVNQWGSTDSTSWIGPITIDTSGIRPAFSASRTGNKVAVVYFKATPTGYANAAINGGLDQDVYYRESVDGGVTFGPKTNITNYDRTQKSAGPWLEVDALYDSNNNLHVVFPATPLPADVYDSTGFFWGDFSASVYHWYQGTGSISRVKNADWGLQFNTQVCGFGGFNTLYVGMTSIGECDGNLYVTWTQIHDIKNTADINDPANIFDDCTSNIVNRGWGANGEVYMSVSGDLTGLLWDAPRNLTNTYTPECDSATGSGGLCEHETKAVLARFGQNGSGLTWPGAELLDPSGTYAGNQFLHMTFVEDFHPSNWGAIGDNSTGPATLNNVRWARLACVDPVTAAQISADVQSIGYPSFTKHGVQKTIPVTVTNDGNAALNITNIVEVVTSGPSGALASSVNTLNVPAGLGNTNTFNIHVNPGGIINSPGTVVTVSGTIYLLSNATNNDSLAISVNNYVIADTVVPVVFDTVSTGTIRMLVSNHGLTGGGTIGGGVNLDYVALGGDCNTAANVYMYDGGPLVVRRDGVGNYSFTCGLFQPGLTDVSFKPVTGASPSFTSNAAYEAYFTGTFVSEDSTIGVQRTYYAPHGGAPNDDFIVVKTRYFSYDGATHQNLLLGEAIDWDIPAVNGSTNRAGIEGDFTWQRGTEGDSAGCQPNATRFGASAFLGMYTSAEFAGDNCVNNTNRHGQFVRPNDPDIFDAPNGVFHPDSLWNRASAGGLAVVTDSSDLHTVSSHVFNYALDGDDTLTVYTVYTTVKNGSTTTLKDNVAAACTWYEANLRPGCTVCGCCVGTVGNVDADPSDGVDISDLTVLIDHLFINNNPLVCEAEGNTDGNPGVDISDLTVLIDHLFINNNPLPGC